MLKIFRSIKRTFKAIIIIIFVANVVSFPQILTPEEFFGFKPGSDGNLFNYQPLIEYLQKLDAASPKLEMRKIGISPLGREMYIAFISSEENIKNLDLLKEINKKITFDAAIPEKEMEGIVEKGKVFFLATLSMHSGEVAPAQSAPLIAYDLITSTDQEVLNWLDNVVYMMVPNHNPDGMDMIVDHYNKYKGSKYDGCSMPGIYHKYVGHDNNRDFVALTQEDTKAIAAIYNLEWFPQVMVEKHQMGSTGPRYFVPPNHDPIAENIDAGIWNWNGLFGSNIIKDLTAKGLSGISQHYIFDDYWPGSTETCIWKNVIGFLTEAASVNYASPVYVEPNELKVYGKGLSEYKKSVNMPLPWPGGWWRLGDIVEYEVESTKSIMKTASSYKNEILKFRNDICKREVERGNTIPPYYYILPKKQHDESEFVNLVNLMMEHGVDVYELNKDVVVENKIYKKGDIVLPLAQAFRPFIKEVMEKQKFPLRHYTPDGEIIKPYDITSWSLPLHRGVESFEIEERISDLEASISIIKDEYITKKESPSDYWAVILDAKNNGSFEAAFNSLKKGIEVERIKESKEIEGNNFSSGSFLVKKTSGLVEILNELNFSPVYIMSETKIRTEKVKLPRIGLVESYFHDMDAGWTRYIFDTYNIPFETVRPGDFDNLDIADKFDVLVFPSENKSVLMEGKYKSGSDYYVTDYPPEYTKGIGKKGLEKIMTFVNNGGLVLSWGESTDLFNGTQKVNLNEKENEEFQLPFDNIADQLQKNGLYIPGSFIKLELLEDHPITYGMESEIGVFYRGNPVFTTSIPRLDMDRRVIGKFPEENLLLSGYSEKEEKIGNKTGLIWLKKGRGQLVLFAFNPQFRASTNVSYKLLFNSLLLRQL